MNIEHKELAKGRWGQMSLIEQMANIGSEVNRAFNWRKKGKEDFSKKAFYRALELLDLTVCFHKKYSQLKEILRVREALVDFFYGDNEFSSTEILWCKYFDQFAYAVRRKY